MNFLQKRLNQSFNNNLEAFLRMGLKVRGVPKKEQPPVDKTSPPQEKSPPQESTLSLPVQEAAPIPASEAKPEAAPIPASEAKPKAAPIPASEAKPKSQEENTQKEITTPPPSIDSDPTQLDIGEDPDGSDNIGDINEFEDETFFGGFSSQSRTPSSVSESAPKANPPSEPKPKPKPSPEPKSVSESGPKSESAPKIETTKTKIETIPETEKKPETTPQKSLSSAELKLKRLIEQRKKREQEKKQKQEQEQKSKQKQEKEKEQNPLPKVPPNNGTNINPSPNTKPNTNLNTDINADPDADVDTDTNDTNINVSQSSNSSSLQSQTQAQAQQNNTEPINPSLQRRTITKNNNNYVASTGFDAELNAFNKFYELFGDEDENEDSNKNKNGSGDESRSKEENTHNDQNQPFTTTKKNNTPSVQNDIKSTIDKNTAAIESCKIKTELSQFSPEDLKIYIKSKIKNPSIASILDEQKITNLADLINITRQIFYAAFDINNGANINDELTNNISNLLKDFINHMYEDLFSIETLKRCKFIETSNHDVISKFNGDAILKAINTYINNHMDGGQYKDNFINVSASSKKNAPAFLLQPLVEGCAKKFCYDWHNDNLQYDENLTLDQLSTAPLRSLNLKNENDTRYLFVSEMDPQTKQYIQTTNDFIAGWIGKLATFNKNFGTAITNLQVIDTSKDSGYKTLKWDNLIKLKAVQYHLRSHPDLQSLNEYVNLTPAGYMNLKIRRSVISMLLRVKDILYDDLDKLRNMQQIIQKVSLKPEVYKELTEIKDYHNFPIYGFTLDGIYTSASGIDLIAPDKLNRKRVTSKNVKKSANLNRILIRLASNVSQEQLQMFYQQPYGKLLVSLLCGTGALAASKRFGFNNSDRQYAFMSAPKLQKYIKTYLKDHKEQLKNLQDDVISLIKRILHNNENLFNVLPPIDLLNNINNIEFINTNNDSFSQINDVLSNDKVELIPYLIWRFSHEGILKNKELKQYFRRYVIQPRVIKVLNEKLPELIEKFKQQVISSMRGEL